MTLHTDYAHYVFGRYKNMKLLRAFVSFLGKVYYRNADVVILPSEKATGYPQVEKVREKLAIVPNGIKLERLQKTLFPAVKLLIVGDGPQRSTLEKYCDNNGLSESVCFTGNIPYDEVYRYYSLGDVFISASSFENMPLTYLEAMACGLPLL